MEPQEKENIEQIVNGFITEMNAWEIYCHKVDTENPYDEESKLEKAKVIEIFNTYCTKKERKYGKPDCISYGLEGSYNYNPEEKKITEIEEIKPNRIEVKTERTKPMEQKQIYILLKKKGTWLIDSKKRYSGWKQKWENAIL